MKLEKLIAKLQTIPNCRVYPQSGLPATEGDLKLPDDVREFYELCGGVVLYENTDYKSYIVPPQSFQPANPVIIGEQVEEDISSKWYIIASDGASEYLTIDLHPDRLGKCYDSFSDRHGVVGETQVIALSFTDLLEQLIANQGQYWYWLKEDFSSLGDAYDDVELD